MKVIYCLSFSALHTRHDSDIRSHYCLAHTQLPKANFYVSIFTQKIIMVLIEKKKGDKSYETMYTLKKIYIYIKHGHFLVISASRKSIF